MNKTGRTTRLFRSTVCFLVFAYGISWIVWIPEALARFGVPSSQVLHKFYLMAQFGPAAAALLAAGLCEGREAVKLLTASIVRVRVPILWYVLILLMPMTTLLVALVAFRLLGHTAPALGELLDIPLVIALGVPLSLGEELGWRGFLLDRLMRRKSGLAASGWVALWWGLWHMPAYLAQSGSTAFYFLFLVGTFPVSALFTIIYLRTSSVFLCVIFHAAIDATANYFSPLISPHHLLFFGLWTAVLWLAATPAVVALITFDRRRILLPGRDELSPQSQRS